MKNENHSFFSSEALDNLKAVEERAQKMSKELAASIQHAMDNIPKMQQNIAPLAQKIAEGLKRFQQEAPESTKLLAEYGWYPTMWMAPREIIEAAEKIENRQVDTVNREMMEHYSEIYNIIKDDVIKKFPHRKEPLNEAFWAHENEKYYLSIPVFLTQADGICKELTESSLFGAKKKKKNVYKPYTEEWAEQFTTDYLIGVLIEPLKHKGGANKHSSEKKAEGIITRHQVLHGESFDYGEELHSYRALSLLYFVSDIVNKAKEGIEKSKSHNHSSKK